MKKKLVMLSMLIVGALAVAACGGGSNNGDAPADPPAPPVTTNEGTQDVEPPPADGGGRTHLNIVTGSLPVSMDPIMRNDNASSQVNKNLYSTLVLMDYDTFEVLPSLATSWDMPDAQTINMTIRQGVVFHNGDPLTAHDVQFTLERAAVSAEVEIIIGMMDRVVVHNDYEFTIYLQFPFAPIMRHLAHPTLGIVPMNHVNTVGEEHFENNPVGSGPFEFVSIMLGDRVELRRFEGYWGTLPTLETVTIRQIAEPSVRLMEVQAGTADFATGIAPVDVPTANADANVNLMRRTALGNSYIGMNVTRPYLYSPLVRQAINYALDTQAIVNAVWGDVGSVQRGPFNDIVWSFYQGLELYPVNLDRARELLAEAGYPNGFDTNIWWNIGNGQREQVAEMVQFALSQIGINVEIHAMEWPVILERSANAEHDLFIMGWSTVTGDPDYGLFPLFHSSNFGAAGNRTFWATPELDALLEAGRFAVDDQERLDIYREAQIMIRDQAPWVFLHQSETLEAVSHDLRGYQINPAGHFNLATIWFAD
ncbi:MAG: ABC transporter substrate-binding protein [Defluviitaleaceae bacterium]|nr:ABC transporter substrate-binding protein [Defluviitaleaceae bacterium]